MARQNQHEGRRHPLCQVAKTMRVLMLTWEYPPKIVGGISRVLGGLSPALVDAGCAVDVITLSEAGEPSYEAHKGVRVHRVNIATIPQKDFFS